MTVDDEQGALTVIEVNLVEFLRSGHFGGLRLGITGLEVKALLGEPDDTSVQDYPRIWKYGRFQIALDENRVVSMTAYFEQWRDRPSKMISFKGWKASSGTSIEDFEKLCAKEGMVCRTHPNWNYEDAVGLVLDSGVSAYFERKGKESSLCGLSLMNKEYGAARAALRLTEIQGIVDHLEKRVDQGKSKKPGG